MKKHLLLYTLLLTSAATIAQKLPLTLESIWSGYFDEKNLQPHILNTRPAISFIRADRATNYEAILTLDMVTGKIIDTVFTNQALLQNEGKAVTFAFFEDFSFSPDDKTILIKTERQAVYHTSYKEFIYLWNNTKKTLKPLSTDGKVSYPEFNKQGNLLAYIRDANLYFKNIDNDKITTVTTDGNAGGIINAMADEVYEDGFGLGKMYQWSPNGKKIAFIKINQGFVKKQPITTFDKNDAVVRQQVFAKPGEAISEAAVFIYDIDNTAFSKLDLGSVSNQYITNLTWANDGASVIVERLNRQQNKLDLVQCNSINGAAIKTVYTEEKPTYINIYPNNMVANPSATSFYYLTEKSGYKHIHEINYATAVSKQITTGNWDVNTIEKVTANDSTIYFTANLFWPEQNNLYSINTNGLGLKKVSNTNGYHTTWFSSQGDYYFDKVTTINTPSVYKIYKSTGKEITNKAIIENKQYQEKIKPFDVNPAKFFSFENNGNIIHGWVINGDTLPIAKGTTKPLILIVYGGNNKQEVTDEWNDRQTMTYRYFANKGYTIACIDPSGAPNYGEGFKKSTFNSLTKNAVEDIIAAKEYLVKKYNVAADNTTLMGWSYGGYLATLFATKYAGTFNKTIAIAPVTNWRNYNAVYTERLIGLPSDNPELYKALMPEEYASNYKGGLLVLHGTADDNVHVQHSLKLAKTLTDADADYDVHLFTDKGHNLSDGAIDKTRMNLYRFIYKFLRETNEK